MRKPLLYFLFIFTLITSCTKEDDPKPDCEVNHYAFLTISNSSSNPYKIYINNKYVGQMDGNSMSKVKISEGNDQKLFAIQVSGYIFYPTEKTSYLNVLKCSDYAWQIP